MTAIPKISALFETSLASALSAAGTSFTVVSGTDRDGNALSGLYGFIIDEGSADEEFVVGTISGTTVTISKRGCDADAPETEVSANKKAHRRGVSVKITDYPILAYLRNAIAGEAGYELPALLKQATSVGNPTDDNHLVRKLYADQILSGGTGIPNRVVVSGTAGATIADGDLIYFDETDNEWKLCDADTAATVENVFLGIAQGAGTDGVAITNGVLILGVDDAQSGMTIGDVMYASNTAGDISSSAGTKEVTIGIALTATQLYFNPRFNQLITEDIQDALASTTALSSGNKVLSQKDFQIGAEVYAASSAGSDTYAVTLSPAPAAYVNGMTFKVKLDVANTGPATLNVNSLGAIALNKNHDQALETGDLEANQIITVTYNSTGPKFQISELASVPQYKNGETTKVESDASTTQNIAHGLGRTPKYVRIKAVAIQATATVGSYRTAEAVYNGTTQTSLSYSDTGTNANDFTTTFILSTVGTSGTNNQTGVITFDATNIIITWTKNGTPGTATWKLVWEAFA